jgi:hypothetical protein
MPIASIEPRVKINSLTIGNDRILNGLATLGFQTAHLAKIDLHAVYIGYMAAPKGKRFIVNPIFAP